MQVAWDGVIDVGELIVELIGVCAWPSVAVIIALLFHTPITDLINRIIEAAGGGIRVKFGEAKGDVETTTTGEALRADRVAIQHRVEHKILNTLWIKQVNRIGQWPESRFMFRIGSDDPDFELFLIFSERLSREGLVNISPAQMIYLTNPGFDFCQQHYGEFGESQWWTDEQLKKENLSDALKWQPDQ